MTDDGQPVPRMEAVLSPIGEVLPREFPAVVALWEEAGLTRPWNDPEADLRRALRGPASTVLGARRGAEVIGTVMVGHDGHRGWVYYLAVRSSEQGHGVGRRLLATAEEWLRAHGAVKVQLMVRTGNDVGGFYEQLGYTDAGVTTYGKRFTELRPRTDQGSPLDAQSHALGEERGQQL